MSKQQVNRKHVQKKQNTGAWSGSKYWAISLPAWRLAPRFLTYPGYPNHPNKYTLEN